MAMLISKFHRIIQSRLIWGAFAVLIILSFVVWGSAPYWADGSTQAGARTAGTLSGRKVTEAQLRDAQSHVYLSVALSVGSLPKDLPADMLREAAVRRLVLMDEARRQGITADDRMVQDQIRGMSFFQDKGQFNPAAYAQFVRGFLRGQLGYPERFFLEHMRQEIVIQRLRRTASDASLVPAGEGDRMFNMLKDQFRVEYTVLAPEAVEKSVTADDAAAKAFFGRDPARYTLPARVEIETAFFDASRFSTNLPAVTDSDIEDFYQDHIADYTTLEAAPASTNGVVQAPQRRTRPLAAVREEVTERMQRGFALDRAEAAASRMVGWIAGDAGSPVPFAEAAARMGVTPARLPAFAPGEPVEGVPEPSPEFYEAATALTSAPGYDFSTPVRSGNGVHVLRLVRHIPPRVPEFNEVAERVRVDARADAVQQALRAKAEALRATGARFVEAAEALGFKVEKPAPFTLQDGLQGSDDAQPIMAAVVYANAGEIVEPIPVMDGRWIVARLAERVAAPAADRKTASADLMRMLGQERQRQMVNLWEETLVRERWVSSEPAPAADDMEPSEEPAPVSESL